MFILHLAVLETLRVGLTAMELFFIQMAQNTLESFTMGCSTAKEFLLIRTVVSI